MARWITFYQETTSLLRSVLAQGTRIDTLLRGPVDYALARPSAVVAVLPAPGDSSLGIAVFRRKPSVMAQQKAAAQLQRPIVQPKMPRAATRAGGFLGLTDEETFEEAAPQQKKGWWRKFWDE